MKFIYVDESGDAGVDLGSSPYYILAGLILDSSCWKEYYHQIDDLRRQIRQKFGADFGEFKGSQIFMHQGGAYKLQLKPVELQWIYNNLMALIFDTKISRIIVAQSKLAFRSRHPSQKPETLKKDLRLLTWEAFLSKVEQQLINECNKSGQLVTAVTYIDGKHDKYVYQIVNRYARKYDREQPYASAGIVESPIFIDSAASTLIQLADVLAYSTNYVHRTSNPLESTLRIHAKISTDILTEVVYPLK